MFKKIITVAVISLFCTLFSTEGLAQSFLGSDQTSLDMEWYKKKKKKKKKKKPSDKDEEKTDFKDKLWYGSGINLQFNPFGIGVAPMVGYKVVDRLSFGPRASVYYSVQKVIGYKAFNLVDTELGAFSRLRVFRGFFLQGDISQAWVQNLYQNSNTGEIFKDTQTQLNPYAGGGFNFSRGEGGFSYEISLMYNFRLANDITTNQLPIQYRFALTYGF